MPFINTKEFYYALWLLREEWQTRRVSTIKIIDADTVLTKTSYDIDLRAIRSFRKVFEINDEHPVVIPLDMRGTGPLLDVSIVDDEGRPLSICRKSQNTEVGASYLLGMFLNLTSQPDTEIPSADLRNLHRDLVLAIKPEGGTLQQDFKSLVKNNQILLSLDPENLFLFRSWFNLLQITYFLCVDISSLIKNDDRDRIVLKFSVTEISPNSNTAYLEGRKVSPFRILASKIPLQLPGFFDKVGGTHARIIAPQGMVIDDYHLEFTGGKQLTDKDGARNITTKPHGGAEKIIVEVAAHPDVIELHDTGNHITRGIASSPPLTLVLNPKRRLLLFPAFVISFVMVMATGLLLFLPNSFGDADIAITVYSVILPLVATFVGIRENEHDLAFRTVNAARLALVLAAMSTLLSGMVVGLTGYSKVPGRWIDFHIFTTFYVRFEQINTDGQIATIALYATLILSLISMLTSGFYCARIELMRKPHFKAYMRTMSDTVNKRLGKGRRFILYAINPLSYAICILFTIHYICIRPIIRWRKNSLTATD